MIDIFICEDNQKQLVLFTQNIRDTIMIEELDMEIALATTNPHAVLDRLADTENLGLFFLDIDLKSDIDGLMLAQRIRKQQPRCFIIFLTSHSEMSFLTFQYKVEALDFIIKDTAEHIKYKIHECLLDVQQKYTSLNNNINKTFVIRHADKYISIDFDDILFFETSNNIHKILLHAHKRVIEFNGQLKEIEHQLDHRFYRCHRSYIINKDAIAEADFDAMNLLMKNGETCPIAVRHKRGLRKLMSLE